MQTDRRVIRGCLESQVSGKFCGNGEESDPDEIKGSVFKKS